MKTRYNHFYADYYDPEPKEEWAKPRRDVEIISANTITYITVRTSGQRQRTYSRNNRHVIASLRRWERLCNAAWPETNGLILNVGILDGPTFKITRPGYVVSE